MIVVSRSVVSNAFTLAAALAFLPVVFGADRDIRVSDAVRKAFLLWLLDIDVAACVEREPATGAVR